MAAFPMEPPRELVMPHAWDLGFLIFSGSVAALFVLWGLWQTVSKGEPLLLFLLIGGLVGEMLEPICNVLGMAYHPEAGQIVGFHTLGRDIPLWLVLCYPWYFGAFSRQVIAWDARGELTLGRYWKVFGVAAFFCLAIEVFPVQAVLWKYYGPQPVMYAGLPLSWYIVNPTSVLATAAFLALSVRGRAGWQRWPVLILMPICIVGFHTGVYAPLYITQNAGWSANQSILTLVVVAGFAATLLTTFSRLLLSARPIEQSAYAQR
ncbi:MAG: hypothetical protein HY900_19245 [Deltaproteobacteria bacterium]|nr:hypothetical protein [Deltaproteobacteria bacterium]